MSLPRRRFVSAVLPAVLWLAGAAVLPAQERLTPAQDRLTPAQEARLKKYLPRTYAKFQRREAVRVVVTGDSISTFYQPAGFPRYDSGMAWEGRLLSRLSGFFSYHGTVFDAEPHREITASQKKSGAEWDKYSAALSAWTKNRKGPAPEAPDTFRFRADSGSAAPVRMNVGELIRRGLPAGRQPEEGAAVWIYNMARDGAQAPQVLESLTTSAFPAAPAAGPDLVTICYGMNDALAGSPLSGYRAFLEQAVKICRARGADVLLAAPPVSFDPAHPRESMGRARPYAMVAHEVAAALGVYCVDLGAANVRAPSDLFSLTASGAFAAAIAPVRRQFAYGEGITETLHPNSAATLRMGDLAAADLLDASPGEPVEVTGVLNPSPAAGQPGGTEAELSLRLFNPGTSPRTVVVSPLLFSGWRVKPGTPDALFSIAPGRARRMKIPMLRAQGAEARSALAGGFIYGSVLLSDDDTQRIADVKVRQQPLSLVWPEERIDQASGDVLLNTTLINTGGAPVRSTARVSWMGRTAELPVSLEPGASMALPLRLALPEVRPETVRFLEKVSVSLEAGGSVLTFEHQVEGVRYAGLEQSLPMVPLDKWAAPAPDNDPEAAGARLTVRADPDGIWFFVEVPSQVTPGRQEGKPWGVVEVRMDGRKAGENGTAGFVDRLTADIPWEDGEAPVRPVRPAAFGNGYNFNYQPGGFRSRVSTRADGSRRIEFAVMRSNLALHEWSLSGGGQSTLGFNVNLNIEDAGGAPDTAKSSAVTLTDFADSDARGLTVLELSRTPAPRWSLRVF